MHRASIASFLQSVLAIAMSSETTLAATNPIKIKCKLSSAAFHTKYAGQSNIVVNYQLDGATLGASIDNNDFYVVQRLQDGHNCNAPYSAGVTSLDGAIEPSTTGIESTTTVLTNMIDWPKGMNRFCLRVILMLQMSDDDDIVWDHMDFKFAVNVDPTNSSIDVVYAAIGNTNCPTFESKGVQTSVSFDAAFSPDVSISVNGGPFSYGQTIPITISTKGPLEAFTYTVDTANVILVDDDLSIAWSDGGVNHLMTIPTSTFVIDSNLKAEGVIGTLTITLPLAIFEMKTSQKVRILIPVSWIQNHQQNRRVLTEGITYIGPPSGILNKFVEVELLSHANKSDAVVGFTLGDVAATICLGTAVACLSF